MLEKGYILDKAQYTETYSNRFIELFRDMVRHEEKFDPDFPELWYDSDDLETIEGDFVNSSDSD